MMPLVDEQVLEAVVVEVAPDDTHADTGAQPIQVGDPHLRGDRLGRVA